tara:strand:- start:838 stop:1245 length:408 start_codon:yes stop_codon:yes gene_type:complete
MADAVRKGASGADLDVDVRFLRARMAGTRDLLWAEGLILGTPENFGYMSGAMKDFMDRTYYPTEGKVQGLPYCLFVSAGNDGTGAVRSIRRIANGYAFREVQEPIIAVGEVGTDVLTRCEDMGMGMAIALEQGIF